MSDAPADIGQVYRWWWLHDARWYQEVASQVGFDVANKINANALRFVAERVARSVAQEAQRPLQELEWSAVMELFALCPRRMWPGDLIDFEIQATEPGCVDVEIRRNFALAMLERAGTLPHYDCPCLALREGWFQGLGLSLKENRIVSCLRHGAPSCRLHGVVAEFADACPASSRPEPEVEP